MIQAYQKRTAWLVTIFVFLALPVFSVFAAWVAPSDTPPNGNIPAPVNVGNTPQNKNGGYLMLSNVGTGSTLALRETGSSNTIFFRVNSGDGSNNTARWILPSATPPIGQVLIVGPDTDSDATTMNLKWEDPSTMAGQDTDWYYYPNNAQSGNTKINSQKFVAITTGNWGDATNYTNNSGTRTSKGAGDVYIQDELEVDGTSTFDGVVSFNNTVNYNNNLTITGLTPGATLFGGASGTLAWDASNFFWNNTNKNLGIGTNAQPSNVKLQINPGANTEGLRIVTAVAYSPLNIRNNANNADIFRVDQAGALVVGTVPWARLNGFPALCSGGQVLSGYTAAGAPNCVTAGMAAGTVSGQTLRWNGSAWEANTMLFNNGSRVGINTASPDANYILDANGAIKATGLNLGFSTGAVPFQGANGFEYDDHKLMYDKNNGRLMINGYTSPGVFTLDVNGSVGPNVDNVYDLGSATYRWRNIFATGLSLGGFTQGSVIFQGASGLAQNNDNFFWDDTTKQLALGSKLVDGRLAAFSDLRLGSYGAEVTASGDTVSGIGTFFTYEFSPGDKIIINNQERTVTDVVSDEELKISPNLTVGSYPYYIKTRSFAIDTEDDNESTQLFVNDGLHLAGVYDYRTDLISSKIIRLYSADRLLMHNHGYYTSEIIGDESVGYKFSNLFLGINSGQKVIESSLNSSFGYNSMSNTSSNIIGNSAFGAFALSATEGTSTIGEYNNAFGAYASFRNVTGMHNIAVGSFALLGNTVGSYNVAVGNEALFANATSNGNIAIGYRSLYKNIELTDGGNVSVGTSAGENNVAGSRNVFIGTGSALHNSGSRNVFIGYNSGQSEPGSDTLIINNEVSDQYGNLIYGKFASAGAGNSFVRFNGDKIQVKDSATSYKNGRTDMICTDPDNYPRATYFIKGIMVCSYSAPGIGCVGATLGDRCLSIGTCN